jgi:hypothetical protein
MIFKDSLTTEELEELLKPSLRLFMSVDVVGSTAFKQKTESWLEFVHGFYTFYTGFPEVLAGQVGLHCKKANQPERQAPPLLWKALGDELIFTALIAHETDAEIYLSAFRAALVQQIRNISTGAQRLPISFKGTAWLAGFPLWNSAIPMQHDNSSVPSYDYVGPLIDVGFRLTNMASPRKLVVSADLAWFIARQERSGLKFLYDGRVTLKGVLNDRPYPIFWIDCLDKDIAPADHRIGKLEDKMLGVQELTMDEVEEFAELFINTLHGEIPRPFINGGPDLPPDFIVRLDVRRAELLRIYMRKETDDTDGATPETTQGDLLENWQPLEKP